MRETRTAARAGHPDPGAPTTPGGKGLSVEKALMPAVATIAPLAVGR